MEGTAVASAVLSLMVLLGIAAVIYLVARRLKLQFPVTLVLVGLALGELARRAPVLAPVGRLELTPEVVTFILLPALIFQAALSLDTRLLLRHGLPVLALAVPSVIVSFALVGMGLHWAIGLPLGAALLFGALVSATDSTAAVAVFREMGGPTRLNVVMEGENLFNDATAILVFWMTAGFLGLAGSAPAAGGAELVLPAALTFLANFFGGLLLGWAFGVAFGKLIEQIHEEESIQILLTMVAAYLAFLVGELLLGVSGVMAAVGAGLTLSGWGRTKFSPNALEFLERYWSYVAFVASSLAFLLVGITIDVASLGASLVPILWAIAVAVLARAVSIFGLFPVVNRLPGVEHADLRYQTVIVWGGLRGAVPLVLAMSLPESFAWRGLLLDLSIGVVLFSLLVQGTTLKALIRWFGLHEPSLSEAYLRDEGLLSAKHRARQRIGELRSAGFFSEGVMGELDTRYADEERALRGKIEVLRQQGLLGSREELKLFKRQYMLMEKRAYLDLFNRGQLSEKVLKGLQHSIELQLDYLRAGQVLPSWTIHTALRLRLGEAVFRVLDGLFPGHPLVQRVRLNHIADRYEEHWGRMLATERILEELRRLEREGGRADLLPELMEVYTRWHANAKGRLDSIVEQFPEYATKVQELMAARLCIQAEDDVVGELERLQILPDREARAMRRELREKLGRLRHKPIEELRPRLRELLGRVPLFQGLPEDEFERVVERLSPRTFLADEVILREGELGDALYLIGRGLVRVTVGGEGVGARELATLRSGDFFGEMAVLSGNARTATATAITHCALYRLRRDDLKSLAGICPVLQQVLETTYRQRSRELSAFRSTGDEDPSGQAALR